MLFIAQLKGKGLLDKECFKLQHKRKETQHETNRGVFGAKSVGAALKLLPVSTAN